MKIEMGTFSKDVRLELSGPNRIVASLTITTNGSELLVKVECPKNIEVSYNQKELTIKQLIDIELLNQMELKRKRASRIFVRYLGSGYDIHYRLLDSYGYERLTDFADVSARTLARFKWMDPLILKEIKNELSLYYLDFKSEFTYDEILEMPIAELELNRNITSSLRQAGYTRIKHIVVVDNKILSRIKGLNLVKVKNIRRKIENLPAIIENYHKSIS